jgi:hypothetical protein
MEKSARIKKSDFHQKMQNPSRKSKSAIELGKNNMSK